ncbi:MAG: saccharopine dehydrogenase NADP-binding domain-containing protein [Rickettsiales bacterium]|jgi:saccharopine dehydrogenase-like NADP-dependent oxidoreductase|nr:saccharopine dehydrogenase NADP-binding domain-containing protein [Rickettsiales bacterium]
MNKVLILGGYGNFGKRIAHALVRSGVPVIIAGRNQQKAEALAATLGLLAKAAMVDAEYDLADALKRLKPGVVVNTCGPFQLKNYDVAEVCIGAGVHYIDLADGREFVTGISALGAKAKAAGVTVISGASTVPGLSSAVLEHYKEEFSQIDSLVYGISPGQKAERGLATTQAILTYIGKALKPVTGDANPRYGWQNVYRQEYPELGKRWMANCDIPDLDLLPKHYGIKNIRFSAGMENIFLHLGIWGMSWLVRLGLPLHLEKHAAFLLRVSHWFDHFGTADGGMHVIMSGTGKNGQPHKRIWFIVAKSGDGPQIPCVPTIILARKLATGQSITAGAEPCVGMVTLEEYLEELKPFNICTYNNSKA